jgi:hypothetical protein
MYASFTADICVVLIAWAEKKIPDPSFVPNPLVPALVATEIRVPDIRPDVADRKIAIMLVDFLISNCHVENTAIMRNNINLVRLFLTHWR